MEGYKICCNKIGKKIDQFLTHILKNFDHPPDVFKILSLSV